MIIIIIFFLLLFDSRVVEPVLQDPVSHSDVDMTSQSELEGAEPGNSQLRNVACHNADQIMRIQDTVLLPERYKDFQTMLANTSQVLRQQLELVESLRRLPNYLEKFPVSPPARSDMYQGPCGFQAARIFLSQMGFLSVDNRDRLVPVPLNLLGPGPVKSSSGLGFHELLEDLDNTLERETATISVLFVVSGKDKLEKTLVTNFTKTVTQDFLDFTYSLGWPVDLKTHAGFKGGLSHSICPTAPYYSDLFTEVIFYVPCLLKAQFPFVHPLRHQMQSLTDIQEFFTPPSSSSVSSSPVNSVPFPSLEESVKEKSDMTCKEMLERNPVQIVWIEDQMDFGQVTRELGGQSSVFIFVTPLHTTPGQYLIRIVSRSKKTADFGPLADGMIVSRHRLGEMVRMTAISAHSAGETARGVRKDPYLERRKRIDAIYTECKRPETSLWRFYAGMFGEM